MTTTTARGPFDVKVSPQTSDERPGGSALARLALDKQFHGDLEGTGKGEMLSAGTPTTGSGAYVAIERVTGTLHGRRGTFVLMHQGIMTRGTPQLSIAVVPDSGTGELVGLTGTLNVIIAPGGAHSYEFAYTLPA